MNDTINLKPRQFKEIMELANKKLIAILAMKLVEVAKGEQQKGRNSSSGASYILQSTLSPDYRTDPNLFPVSDRDKLEGQKVFVLSLVYLSAGIISEGLKA